MRINLGIIVAAALAVAAPASPQIVADFTADKTVGWVPFAVQFTNLSSYPPDPNVEFFWDFGDGEFSAEKHPTHLYLSPGVFTVSLAVHAFDEVGEVTKQQFITALDLEVSFSAAPTLGVAPLFVQFQDDSVPDGFSAAYFWEFGDGQTTTARHPLHLYESEGVYDVSLTVAVHDGPMKTATKQKLVHVMPWVPFLQLLSTCKNVATHYPTVESQIFVHTDLGRACGLTSENVRVTENGVLQNVEGFFCDPTLNQADFVFVIDQSGSMGDNIDAVRAGAKAFAAHAVKVGVDARFALVAYEREPQFILDLTAEVADFEAALDTVRIFGGIEPALDSLLFALDSVSFRPCAQKSFVLLTDEPTNGDVHTMAETVEIVNREGAAVMAISPDFGADFDPGFDVKTLAHDTGGLWFDILGADYTLILEEIVEFALGGWTLRYTTTNQVPPGSEREVRIRVTDPLAGSDNVVFTYVERPEFVATRDTFRSSDLNGDGRLGRSEAGLATFTFDELDLDHNGFLTLPELLAQTAGPVGVSTPVWVDFSYGGTETGTADQPFNTLDEGIAFVAVGGEVRVLGGRDSLQYTGGYALRKPVRLVASGGTVLIGAGP